MSTPNLRVSAPPKDPAPAQPQAPPTPGGRPPSRPALKASLSLQDWLMRLLVVVVIAACAAAIFYSYQRLAKLQAQGRKLDATVSQMNNDVQILEGKYTKEDVDRLMARSREAEALLFAGQDALYNWFQDLQLRLVPLALTAKANFGAAITNKSPHHALAVVPATVSLEVGPADKVEARRSPYQRVMELMSQLAQQPKRVDVVGLDAQGGTNSIAEAKVVLELWAGEGSK